jgi:hypothetical protein
LGGLKVESADENIRRYNTNWLQRIQTMDSNRMLKLMLNCGQNRQRRLGTTLNGLPDESETGLNCYVLLLLLLSSLQILSKYFSFWEEMRAK